VNISEMIQDRRVVTKVIESDMWLIELCNDLDRFSRSFQLYFSGNKCSFFWSLIMFRRSNK